MKDIVDLVILGWGVVLMALSIAVSFYLLLCVVGVVRPTVDGLAFSLLIVGGTEPTRRIVNARIATTEDQRS